MQTTKTPEALRSIKFTANEKAVLSALIVSSSGNGHDFGFVEDARGALPTARALPGVITSLTRKGILMSEGARNMGPEVGEVIQFTWNCVRGDERAFVNALSELVEDAPATPAPTHVTPSSAPSSSLLAVDMRTASDAQLAEIRALAEQLAALATSEQNRRSDALQDKLPREEKLWGELTEAERKAEKRDFLADMAAECGGKPQDYAMQWEQYLNQEGWTGRDMRILMRRDAQR